jgi:peptide/nickel transport system ATP-binding protein
MPYTRGLLESIPVLGEVRDELAVIPGAVPSLIDLPPGCRFAPRCAARVEHGLSICTEVEPSLLPVDEDHAVRCWLFHDHPASGFEAPLAPGRAGQGADGRWAAGGE